MRRRLAVLVGLLGLAGPVSAAVQWVERPDDMAVFWFHDADQNGEHVRILYSTTPSLQQGQADPQGWRSNVYLVEADTEGGIEQRQLASYHGHFTKLFLRRGHDEVIVVRRPDKQGGPQGLETWSTENGSVRSSISAPRLLGAKGKRPVDLTYSAPTSDGNLFIVTQTANGPGNGLHWYKLSPGGKVLGQGQYMPQRAQVSTNGRFPAHGGGIGLSVGLRLVRGADGLDTDLDTPITRKVGGRTLEARVFSETRLLVTDSEARRLWVSPALERQLTWGGQMQVPNDLPSQERMHQTREQMGLMEETELELGARRKLVSVSGSHAVKAVPGGYGMLAKVTANRKRQPPAHGPYYLELTEDGTLHAEIYLDPVAEELDAKFENFLRDQDGLILAGSRRSKRPRGTKTHLTRVTGDGGLDWSTLLEAPPRTLDGIARAGSTVWVFGHAQHKAQGKIALWLEKPHRKAAPGAETRRTESSPGTKQRQSPEVTRTVQEPATGGCSCSCAEFEQIQRLAGQVQGIPEPAVMQKLLCAQRCVSQYTACARR